MPKGKNKANPLLNMWARRKLVEKYLRRGFTDQREIAAALGCSQNTICYDIQAILETWQSSEPEAMRDRATTRIKQLEAIIQEAWNAWEVSKASQKEVGIVTAPCGTCRGVEPDAGQPPCLTCGGRGAIATVSRKTKRQTGDPSYLAVIRDCVKECGRLEGLYAPNVVNKTLNKTVNVMSLPTATGSYAQTPTELILQARQALLAAANANNVTLDSKFVHRDKPEEAA